LVIEDAPAGIDAAHAAGMKVVALMTTYPAAALQEADAIARALADVSVDLSNDGLKMRVDDAGSLIT
jgi:beta-phosphoglucomutase-like phosphatase (HAD superfamily)